MPIRQTLYLFLSIVGLLTTWYFNFQHMYDTETTLFTFNLMDFLRDGFSNAAASSLSSDLFIGAAGASLFIIFEGRRLRIKSWWIYLLLNNLVAFAFAFPLFLFVRERTLEQ